MDRMRKTSQNRIKTAPLIILIWLIFSLITGFSVAAIYTTGGNLDKFYNRGDFLPFYSDSFAKYGQNVSYEAEKRKFTITEEGASFSLNGINKENEWNYLRVGLTQLNVDALDVQITY